ncbi:MAG: DUF6008 family protein [Jatrophihabitans sp.]
MGNMNMVSGWDTTGAILMVLWALGMWSAVGVLAFANHTRLRPWVYQGSIALILVGVVGQVGHLQEHVAQAGYWVKHPNAKPWMTPWGTGLAKGFGRVDQSKPSLGMEILHLTGNFIFLAGIAGIMVITYRARQTKARKWGKMGMWMQGIHGLEHLSLTLSVAFGAKRAIGLSTWFGVLPNGPGLWTYRIWWHAIANVIGSTIFAIGLFYLYKERAAVRAAYWGPAAVHAQPEPTRAPRVQPVSGSARAAS